MLAFSDSHRTQASAASELSNRRGGERVDLYAKTAEDLRRSAAKNEQLAKDTKEVATELELGARGAAALAITAGSIRDPRGGFLAGLVGLVAVGLEALAMALNDLVETFRQAAERDRKKAEKIERREIEKALENIREGRGETLTGPHGDALAPDRHHDSDTMYA